MRAPAFWDDPSDWRGRVLAPLGWLTACATARRLRRGKPAKLPVPVICIGNLHAGGTGKTPTTIALVQRLRDQGHVPMVISRGYGGRLTGPVMVDPARHKASDVGDEPLLIAAFADICIARDRAAAGRMAVEQGATIIVMDDGFQNPSLATDLRFVVVPALTGFGNARCLPAGPLREPVQTGLARADALISIGGPTAQNGFHAPATIPRLNAELKPLQTGMDWSGQTWLAFAGIGRPENFFATLRAAGATLHRTEALGDHEPLSAALLTRLEREAQANGAQLVTTEKDAARLPPAWRGKVLTLPVRLEFENPEALDTLLKQFPAP